METIITHTEVSFCLAAYRGFYLNIFQTLGEINNFLESSWKLRGNKAGKKCRSGRREGKKNRGETKEGRKGGRREKKEREINRKGEREGREEGRMRKGEVEWGGGREGQRSEYLLVQVCYSLVL